MAKLSTIGMAIRPLGLEWTALTPGAGGALRKNTPRSVEKPDDGKTWSDRFENLLSAESTLPKGLIHLAIPADGLLLRVFDLPSIDPTEIQGMVELQIDQFSPFPIELLHISWEILDQTDTRSRVLVAGARRATVEKLGAAAEAHRLRIVRIDADILGWLYLLKKQGKLSSHGRHLLVLDDASHPMLVVLDQGHPILFRSLPLPDPTDPQWQTVLSEEIGSALGEVEAEWGTAPLAGCTLLHWGGEPHGVDVLKRDLGVSVEIASLGELPALSDGIAGRADARLDLSPQAWKDQAAARAQRKKTLVMAGAAAGVWLAGWAVFLGLLSFKESSVLALRKEVDDLAKPADEVKQLERELDFLNTFTNRTDTVLDCMKEVVQLLPASGIQFGDFTFKKGVGVSVRGEGLPNPVLAYTKSLGASTLFKGLDDLQVENGKFNFNAKLASAALVESEAKSNKARLAGKHP